MSTASAVQHDGNLISGNQPMPASVEVGDDVGVAEKLGDQLHSKTAILETENTIHFYSFVAVRGQKVMLANPINNDVPVHWEVEYFENDEWKKLIGNLKVFQGLEPGAEVNVRISHKKDQPHSMLPYTLVFGSSPVLKEYRLSDQYRMKRIPSGFTQPSFLPVQGSIAAELEASFTDSVGVPLKGAIGRFVLDLKESRIRPVVEWVVSDAEGRVSKTVSFERCYGGRESGEINYFYGPGTWRSYYYVGTYHFANAYLDPSAQISVPLGQVFGHVCGHRKVRR